MEGLLREGRVGGGSESSGWWGLVCWGGGGGEVMKGALNLKSALKHFLAFFWEEAVKRGKSGG